MKTYIYIYIIECMSYQKKKLTICILWTSITLNIKKNLFLFWIGFKNNILTTNKPLLYYYVKLYYIYTIHAHILLLLLVLGQTEILLNNN